MSDIATNNTFAERMFERIKSQMGELMTDEELKTLLDKAVNEAFFKPGRKTVGDGYRREEVTTEPRFVELVREQIDAQVKNYAQSCVTAWFNANPNIFKECVDAAIAKGFTKVVMDQINVHMVGPLHQLSMSVDNMRRNG